MWSKLTSAETRRERGVSAGAVPYPGRLALETGGKAGPPSSGGGGAGSGKYCAAGDHGGVGAVETGCCSGWVWLPGWAGVGG